MKYISAILLLALLVAPVLADNITVVNPIETGYIPTPTPIPTVTPTPVTTPTHYISQGEKVYINDTIDISGVVPPYPKLAYWNGYDSYDANASYIIDLPPYRSAYYHFYIDPSIFETRTGKWYKYNDKFEGHGNTLAFVVYPQSYKNITTRYQNGTIINISEMISNNYSETEIPIQPPVEIKHISDYLIARGDEFNIITTNKTNLWLFGRLDKLYDYKSLNNTLINIPEDVLSGFGPGQYTMLAQTTGNKSANFTVIYDNPNNVIKWFDPVSFTIKKISIDGLTPRLVYDKFVAIIPETLDTFKTYKLELQEPSIEISSIKEIDSVNYTIDSAGQTEYETNISYIEVKGYTNVAIGSTLKFIVDKEQQTSRTLYSHTTTAVAGGTKDPGDMRWFDVVIPIEKYGLALGPHTVTAYTMLSDAGATYTFTIYAAPPNSYVEKKTIRYISGKYGAEEFVPTPTPVVETVTQIVTVSVTVMVPVTPSNEQVKAQQKIVADENIKAWSIRIIAGVIIVGMIWYLISLYLRRRELND